MAQFSPVKRLFSGDALSVSGFESKKDPFHHHCKVKDFGGCGGEGLRFTAYSPSIKRGNHECKLGFFDSFAVHASSSSDPRFNDISYGILLEEPVELERDDLSGFRGLVLDISYRCCGSTGNLTIDHVLPIARGGEWTWENLVTACVKCNSKKGQKTLEEANMKLLKVPKAPKDYDILARPPTNNAIKEINAERDAIRVAAVPLEAICIP